jgi:hypothetical protein
MASESRIACFSAIAKGDLPQDAWFHLGRKHTIANGQRVLLSWTGTMFEYLMPALWMRHYSDTLLQQSLAGVIRVQIHAAAAVRTPWGISESAFGRELESGTYEYAAFGIPQLAMKQTADESHVISPYSSFLALCVDPVAAMKNIDKMAKLGWTGEYGFVEAVDYGLTGTEEPVPLRMWMAHHQGMILLAMANLLENSVIQNYFHAEPQVLATELLLHERVPPIMTIERDEADLLGAPTRAAKAA